MRKHCCFQWQSTYAVPGLASLDAECGADGHEQVARLLEHYRDFALVRIHRGSNNSGEAQRIMAMLEYLEYRFACLVSVNHRFPLGRDPGQLSVEITIEYPDIAETRGEVRRAVAYIGSCYEDFDSYHRSPHGGGESSPNGVQ